MKGVRASATRRSLAFRVVRALLVTVACLYLLVAAAIWYGQTTILYHPRKTLSVTPADLGLTFDAVRLPLNGDRLAGWWVPSKLPNAATLLYLHGNAGNVSANADQVRRLADTGLSIFIFDYRGYGESTGGPPRERLATRMRNGPGPTWFASAASSRPTSSSTATRWVVPSLSIWRAGIRMPVG